MLFRSTSSKSNSDGHLGRADRRNKKRVIDRDDNDNNDNDDNNNDEDDQEDRNRRSGDTADKSRNKNKDKDNDDSEEEEDEQEEEEEEEELGEEEDIGSVEHVASLLDWSQALTHRVIRYAESLKGRMLYPENRLAVPRYVCYVKIERLTERQMLCMMEIFNFNFLHY